MASHPPLIRESNRNVRWHSCPLPVVACRILRAFAGRGIAVFRSMSGVQCFVYIIRSRSDPSRYYTGLTSHVAARLVAHNAGRCAHTVSGRHWQVDVVIEFTDEKRAVAFEKYLKSGSGVAFAKRHLR